MLQDLYEEIMKILIIGNCITKECLRIRKNSNYSSAAAQKKLLLMSRTFEKTGHIVDISSASYSKHIHSLFIEKISPDIRIIHSPTIGFFGKFSFFKKTIHVLFCILWILLHPRHYDAVIFYNFHIDFSLPAICADLLSHVKLIKKFRLIMDYEDGLFLDRGYTGIFNRFWEKIVYKRVFHYILVNDGLKERIETIAPSPLNKYITVNGFIDENLLSESKSKHTSSLQQLLFTGNFSKGFGFEQLVDYIENIDENLTLTITGRAGQEETKKIEALSHRKKMYFSTVFLTR